LTQEFHTKFDNLASLAHDIVEKLPDDDRPMLVAKTKLLVANTKLAIAGRNLGKRLGSDVEPAPGMLYLRDRVTSYSFMLPVIAEYGMTAVAALEVARVPEAAKLKEKVSGCLDVLIAFCGHGYYVVGTLCPERYRQT
jgi:hypothetical protein